MKFIDKNGAGFGLLIESKDQEFSRIFSMIIVCIAAGILVGIVAVSLGVASLWVPELRNWPVLKVSLGTIAALWLWCSIIYPVIFWFHSTR